MSYDFSFDKKSAIFIMAGCIAIGALLFFAGFIIGFDHGQSEAKTQPPGEHVVATAPTVAGNSGHSEPEPKPKPGQASASTTDQNSKKAEPKPDQPAAKAEPASKPDAAPADASGKGNASNKEDASSKQAASGKESAAPPAPAEKKTETACQSDAKPSGSPGFALQLGAFKAPENALRMTESMKTRGYVVFQCKLLDMSDHLWYTVRMGPYADLKKASQAAQDFSRKEQIPAFVRPRNEL
jgi:cell division septation protein DedD